MTDETPYEPYYCVRKCHGMPKCTPEHFHTFVTRTGAACPWCRTQWLIDDVRYSEKPVQVH